MKLCYWYNGQPLKWQITSLKATEHYVAFGYKCNECEWIVPGTITDD